MHIQRERVALCDVLSQLCDHHHLVAHRPTLLQVKVVDTLASSACSSGHVFDLNDVTYSTIATEGGATAGCSGHISVQYRPVSCDAVDLVSSGIKIGLLQNQVDPWWHT